MQHPESNLITTFKQISCRDFADGNTVRKDTGSKRFQSRRIVAEHDWRHVYHSDGESPQQIGNRIKVIRVCVRYHKGIQMRDPSRPENGSNRSGTPFCRAEAARVIQQRLPVR